MVIRKSEALDQQFKDNLQQKRIEQLCADLDKDQKLIRKLDDAGLAKWQMRYPKESPQVVLADQEWKYRLIERTTVRSAVISALSAILGAVVGFVLGGIPHN